jgi:hypothetical protein
MAANVLDGQGVRVVAGTQRDVASAIATALLPRDGELVTLMEGADPGPGLAQRAADHARRARPGVEVVRCDRGPVPLLIGVE